MPRVCVVMGFLGSQGASGYSLDSKVSRGPYQGEEWVSPDVLQPMDDSLHHPQKEAGKGEDQRVLGCSSWPFPTEWVWSQLQREHF